MKGCAGRLEKKDINFFKSIGGQRKGPSRRLSPTSAENKVKSSEFRVRSRKDDPLICNTLCPLLCLPVRGRGAIHSVINHGRRRHSRPVFQRGKLQQNLGKHWIPPYQVRGRLRQARNDKLHKICVVMYK